MTGTRRTRAALAALALAVLAAAPSPQTRKPKTESQVKRLTETARADKDERRRREAVAELREADPRAHPDLIPALVGVLQRDPSAAVRADAAEAVGQFKVVSPAAGAALEAAAEADPVAAVRDAAQQALWEYHLSGYRGTKGADGIAGQTAEPPLAARPLPKPTAARVPDPVPPGPAAVPLPKLVPVPPVIVPIPAGTAGPRVILTNAPPLQLDVTEEPPLAKRPPKN